MSFYYQCKGYLRHTLSSTPAPPNSPFPPASYDISLDFKHSLFSHPQTPAICFPYSTADKVPHNKTVVCSSVFKVKAVPLQARSGPEVSRKLRSPGFVTMAQESGKVVSLTHRPPLPPGNAPGTHFC